MAIRITQNSLARSFDADVQSIYAKLARSQQQVSDGRRIVRPSDDPFGTGQVLNFDSQLSDVRRYQANVSESIGFMNSADSALDTVTNALQRIREKATQAANGTNGMSDLQSIAAEVTQLKEVVRDGLNAQHGEVYIFSGTASGTAPYPSPGNNYDGTANNMSRRIGLNQSITINVPGTAVIGPDGSNTLDMIDKLIADIQGGNRAGIQAGLGAVIAAENQALDVRTQLGATASRLEVAHDRLGQTEERLIAARSEIADVDAAEAFMEFNQQQTMYQAALAAGTRIMQTSILDFI